MFAGTTSADEYWHLHLSDCRNIPIYVHTNSRTLPTFEISPGLLTLPALESGDCGINPAVTIYMYL